MGPIVSDNEALVVVRAFHRGSGRKVR